MRWAAAAVRWAGMRAAAATVLAGGALLVPAEPAWAAGEPPVPAHAGSAGAAQASGPDSAAPGPTPDGLGTFASPGGLGPTTRPPPSTGPPPTTRPDGALTTGTAAPPGASPSAPPTAVPSATPTRPPAPPASHGHDHGPGDGRSPGPGGGDGSGPLRPPPLKQPRQPQRPKQPEKPERPKQSKGPYGSGSAGQRPPPGGQMKGNRPSGHPYDPAPVGGSGGDAPSLVQPGGASPEPTTSLPAGSRKETGDARATSPFDRGGPVMRMLPLGAGLVLVGLGLGFLGLRLRRS